MRLFLSILFLSWSLAAQAVTNTVACTYTAITNALMTANDGDCVLVQAGSCHIISQFVLDRNVSVSFKGSGTNLTTLISDGVGGGAFWFKSNSSNLTTISDFNCIGSSGDGSGFFVFGGNPPCAPSLGVYHLYNLKMTNVMYRAIMLGYGDSFGLIDHCVFAAANGANAYNPMCPGGNEYKSWTNANPLGTTNVVCVEDCSFLNAFGAANGGNGHFDGYNGAQIVIRHCVFDGPAPNGVHGYDSQVTANRTLEVYNNVFTNQDSSSDYSALSRGGVFMMVSNIIWIKNGGTATAATMSPVLQYYRAAQASYGGWVGYAGYDMTNTYTTNFINGDQPWEVSNAALGGTGNRYSFGFGTAYQYDSTLQNSDRHIKLGATLAESLTNLYNGMNLGPGSGTTYAAVMTRSPDLYAVSVTATSIVLRSRGDGTNSSFGMPTGYPAAMQNGVLNVVEYTNTGVILYPCYSASNICHNADGSTTLVNFVRAFEGQAPYSPNYVTNLIVQGRDYYNDTLPPYTPLVYPHPLQATEGGGGGGTTTGSYAPVINAGTLNVGR